MAKVVADINANNSKIPTLWAHHIYEADVVDEKHNNHHAGGEGVLLYSSPISMRLRGNATGVGNVFDIGSNPNTFWLRLSPEAGDAMWWGNYADLARINPDTTGIPIRPDMVLDVLGIATINANFNQLPAPTMRYSPEKDSYVFLWIGKLPDRWIALREVWYDRVTKRPSQVLLYDMNGRVALRAELTKYRQVQVEELASVQWPWIPGNYKLTFPDSGSRLIFTLDEAMLKHTDSESETTVPNARSFRMPAPDKAGVSRVIQIGAAAVGNAGR